MQATLAQGLIRLNPPELWHTCACGLLTALLCARLCLLMPLLSFQATENYFEFGF